ncbi:hypothetical protein [Rhodanobacter ginsengiterrae]|uniref:hypothetical protein n=1 Tax=Rhodanobacter ginsengiterrae TaxID=2008451 RepID=UPI003CF33871
MQVCQYKGLVLAVLTRNEHCPPHVHVGSNDWDARFEFSFWHNGVRLWDVSPARNRPAEATLEALRKMLKQPVHLRKARELWWKTRQTICLENQQWDPKASEVVGLRQNVPVHWRSDRHASMRRTTRPFCS